ncbi:MAG: glutaminase A [Phycisphaerales bacterium]
MIDPRERSIFNALLLPGEQRVRVKELLRILTINGLRADDPRLRNVFAKLQELPKAAELTIEEFLDISREGLLTIEGAVAQSMVIPEFPTFVEQVREVFNEAEKNKGGAVADYIPQLGRVDPEQFGLAICTIDGQRMTEGQSSTPFCVQSVSKPFNYCFALEELGEERVHAHMGCEPSGVSFNELALDRRGVPHNPMINAGGIMSCALIRQGDPVADRFDHLTNMWTRLAGGVRPGFSNATYLSERATADRNFALGYSMRESKAFPEGANLIENLEFYFQCCSLEYTADALSVVGATLANGGLCPLTGEQVLQPGVVQSCLSLMLSCGMYDYSGEWAFRIGLPAKSGVSGAVLTIVPNAMGICTWSPRLDQLGNSVRGIDFHTRLVKRFNFHVYDGLGGARRDKIDPRKRKHDDERQLLFDLCWAASEGDVDGIQRLVLRGADPSGADYDGRTPLHLAASEGRPEAIGLLLELGADPDQRDRWGNTPLDDARNNGHDRVAAMLERADDVKVREAAEIVEEKVIEASNEQPDGSVRSG